MLQKGNIVVLNMNIAEYKNLSKIIATYLKLDFQSEIMYRLSNYRSTPSAFICDEYAEYVTKTDADFFALSREAKCINIVSTQSYSSLKNTLKDEINIIIQDLEKQIEELKQINTKEELEEFKNKSVKSLNYLLDGKQKNKFENIEKCKKDITLYYEKNKDSFKLKNMLYDLKT